MSNCAIIGAIKFIASCKNIDLFQSYPLENVEVAVHCHKADLKNVLKFARALSKKNFSFQTFDLHRISHFDIKDSTNFIGHVKLLQQAHSSSVGKEQNADRAETWKALHTLVTDGMIYLYEKLQHWLTSSGSLSWPDVFAAPFSLICNTIPVQRSSSPCLVVTLFSN